ncbi:MAG: hypothetical protein V4726_11730 [Verrucomicrobiota bacterium]
MNKQLDLRLKAFGRSLEVLDLPEHLMIWRDKPPVVFTRLRAEAGQMMVTLEEAGKKQQTGPAGAVAEKELEETELEDAAYSLAQALRVWFSHARQETEAVEMTLPLSEWQRMRDQVLLAKSQRVIDLATAVTAGADAAGAAEYGVTTEAVTTLTKERADYDAIVNTPGVVAAVRKALTKGLPQAFALVENKFGELDSLISQFGRADGGRGMIAAWKDARLQKGQHHRTEKESPAPGPPAPAV